MAFLTHLIAEKKLKPHLTRNFKIIEALLSVYDIVPEGSKVEENLRNLVFAIVKIRDNDKSRAGPTYIPGFLLKNQMREEVFKPLYDGYYEWSDTELSSEEESEHEEEIIEVINIFRYCRFLQITNTL